MWRDMMARVEGPVVSNIQGIIAENWLACCGEILTSAKTYQPYRKAGTSPAFAIRSSPSDRATVSRVLFQMLVESATSHVLIATPYFLPDKAFRRAFARTAPAAASTSRSSCRGHTPTMAGCAWPAGACTARCSSPASESSSTAAA